MCYSSFRKKSDFLYKKPLLANHKHIGYDSKVHQPPFLKSMSSLITLANIAKSIGPKHLFSDLSFSIHSSDKVGIIGPNGSGKSTLLKIMCGIEPYDSGEIILKKGLVMGYAPQRPLIPRMTLLEYLLDSIEGPDRHDLEIKAQQSLSSVGFTDHSAITDTLSGGWKKRLDIAKTLMRDPDILLLDEPTNHLDIESIEWLEGFLAKSLKAIVVISHDRSFLQKATNNTIEINPLYPSGLFQVKGSFYSFFEKKEQFLESQEKKLASLKGKVKQENAWLATTPQARTGKSKSRIESALLLQEELKLLKNRHKKTELNLDFTSSNRQTRKLLSAKSIAKSYSETKPLFSSLELTLTPHTRLGIVGANGSGKTTLLKILSGQEQPSSGTIKTAEGLDIVYFEQAREQIPLHLTLQEALSPGGDMLTYRGKSIHVAGWAKRFGFLPADLPMPIKCLSGGQLARILIARLMLKPADLLFLDEPTNDLDIETLEVLEESLSSFPGSLVLISHDRSLMQNLCNNLLYLENPSTHTFYPSYDLYEKGKKQKATSIKSKESQNTHKKKKASLSYKESKELEGMEKAIEMMEDKIAKLESAITSQGSLETYEKMGKLSGELHEMYERWQHLLDKKEGKL